MPRTTVPRTAATSVGSGQGRVCRTTLRSPVGRGPTRILGWWDSRAARGQSETPAPRLCTPLCYHAAVLLVCRAAGAWGHERLRHQAPPLSPAPNGPGRQPSEWGRGSGSVALKPRAPHLPASCRRPRPAAEGGLGWRVGWRPRGGGWGVPCAPCFFLLDATETTQSPPHPGTAHMPAIHAAPSLSLRAGGQYRPQRGAKP